MFKSYTKAYPTLGLTKEEFGDFLIEECSVRSQFRYIKWLDVMSSNTSQEKNTIEVHSSSFTLLGLAYYIHHR